MIVLLIAALGALLAGVLAILYGVSYKEFSFGNTMLLAGVIGSCTGLVLFGLWIATREMRAIARRIASQPPERRHDVGSADMGPSQTKPAFPSRPPAREPSIAVAPPSQDPQPVYPPFPQTEIEEGAVEPRPSPSDLAPTPVVQPAPETKPRRNLLFESSVRKDRDRAAGTNGGGSPAASATETGQRTVFEDNAAQRAAERAERLQRMRSPSTFSEPKAEAPSDVTVLKSGVVDGMAYSLYSDGSIEAQMPEGMMRFGSIEELRTHLDQRT